jgi:hypothetical protein
MGPVLYTLVPLAIVVAVIVFMAVKLKKTVAKRRVEMQAILAGRTPIREDGQVNCFGLESLGPMQLRGNGLLALANDELVFLMFVPNRVVRMPLDRISVVDECGSWLGKTVFQSLLRVAWQEGAGQERVAFWVRDPSGWRTTIDEARKNSRAVPVP